MHPELPLDELRRRGEIRVGFQRHTPPFSYATGTGFRPIGYSVDLARQVVETLGQELGCELRIRPVEVTSSSREGLLAAGEIDMECGSTTITEDRRQRCAFSRPIFHTSHRIVLKKHWLHWPTRAARITGITGSTSHAALLGETAPDPAFEFSGRSSIGEAFDAFCSDPEIEGMVADEVILASLLRQSPTIEATVLDQRLGGEHYGFLMRLNDRALTDAVDRALGALIDSASFLRQFSPWFDSALPDIGFSLGLDLSEQLQHIATPAAGHSGKLPDQSSIHSQGST